MFTTLFMVKEDDFRRIHCTNHRRDGDSITGRKFQCFCSKGYVLEECGSGKELDKIPNFLHIQPASENLIPCLWFSAFQF